MNIATEDIAILITLMSAVAGFVSAVTEMTKTMGFLAKIPTNIQVVCLSVLSWAAIYATTCATGYYTFAWYMIFAVAAVSLLTAFVAMFGWEKLKEVFARYKNNSKEE